MNKSENTPDSVFKKIYDRYSQLVMRITLSILRDKEHAEDAFQAAFITIAQNADKISDSPEKTENYIRKIAQSAAINIYRKNEKIWKNEIPLSDNEKDENDGERTVRGKKELSVESFEKDLFYKFDRELLLKALDKLDRKYVGIIEEYYYEELTAPQIAEKHGISEDAAYKRLYRAVEKLKVIFLKEGGEG